MWRDRNFKAENDSDTVEKGAGRGGGRELIDIIEKRERLLQILEAYIEGGDMKAIELYSKILTELRNDLKCGEEDDGIPDVFEEIE